MAVSGVALTVEFGVWDVTNGTWKTGDQGNLTLRLVADGAAGTPAAAPAQVDATNKPGAYTIVLTGGENTGTDMSLGGKTATAGCVVIPAHWHNTAAAVLSAQGVADALKLAPTAGDPAEGSVNDKLAEVVADVNGLDGAAMRGTDGAYTGTPPTAQAIATYVWATDVTGAAVAATLAGITSLAAWLRGLGRKSTMDATAKAELNSGGGTYNEGTDSMEAIRDTAPLGTAMRGTDGAYTGTPPSASAIAAVVDAEGGASAALAAYGVALEATLTAMKGAGWTAETLKAIKDQLVIAAADVAGVNGVTPAVAADIPTEADIWTYGARTLTGFGTLVATIWTYITRTLTSGGGVTVEEIDAELTANHGAGVWTSSAGGTGACTVTGTLTCAAVAAPQVQFVIKSSPGGAVQATGQTDENGQFVVQLDTGAYNVYFGPDSRYTFTTPAPLTVASDPQAAPFTCTAATYPTQGMTFGQLKSSVYGAIMQHVDEATGRATIRQVTDEMLGIWVNQAHYQLDADLLWTNEKETVTSVIDQREYALDTDIREVFVATYDGRELRRITTAEDIAKYDANDTSGDPIYWSWWAGTLRLYPAPDTAADDIVLYTLKTPPALVADTNIPGIPPQTHPMIAAHATAQGYLYMGDLERSQKMTEFYLLQVERAKDSIANMRGTPQVIRMDGKVI